MYTFIFDLLQDSQDTKNLIHFISFFFLLFVSILNMFYCTSKCITIHTEDTNSDQPKLQQLNI